MDNPYKCKEVITKRTDHWLAKYGCFPTALKEVQEKIVQTNKNKHNYSGISKQELKIKQKLEIKFNNIEHQYISDKYPFTCDFYIPNLDLYIECNFHWTHGGKPYDSEDIECKEKLKYWKSKSEKSQFYRNAIHTWTIRDVNKFNTAKQNNLNYLVFYSEAEFNNWFNQQNGEL